MIKKYKIYNFKIIFKKKFNKKKFHTIQKFFVKFRIFKFYLQGIKIIKKII